MLKEFAIVAFVFVFLVSIFIMQVPSTTIGFASYPTNIGIGFAYGIFGTFFLIVLASRLSRRNTFKDRQDQMEIEKTRMIEQQFNLERYIEPLQKNFDYVQGLYYGMQEEVKMRKEVEVPDYKLIKKMENTGHVLASLYAALVSLEKKDAYGTGHELSNAWSQSKSLPYSRLTEDLYMLASSVRLTYIEKYVQMKKLKEELSD